MASTRTSLDRYLKRNYPSCKSKIVPIYFKNLSLDTGTNFATHENIPEEAKNSGYHPSIYLLGCPICKNVFFDYLK